MTLPPHRASVRRSKWRKLTLYALTILYIGLVVYGSLYPGVGWRDPGEHILSFVADPWPRYITRTDLTTNFLAYVPLGFLGALALRHRMRLREAVIWVTAGGLALSLLMEMLQMYLPNRVSSNLDILTNGAGTLFGAVMARLAEVSKWPGRPLFSWRERWFLPGFLVNFGLLLLGLWALSQLSLQIPSFVAGNLHSRFTPFWETLQDPLSFRPVQALIYMLEITGLGLFAATMIRPGHRMIPIVVAVFAAAVLLKFLAAAALLKVTVLTRLFSLEAIVGLGAGLGLLVFILKSDRRKPFGYAILTLGCFIGAKIAYGLSQSEGTAFMFQNLVLSSKLFNVTSFAQMVSEVWPFLAILFLMVHWIFSRVLTSR